MTDLKNIFIVIIFVENSIEGFSNKAMHMPI